MAHLEVEHPPSMVYGVQRHGEPSRSIRGCHAAMDGPCKEALLWQEASSSESAAPESVTEQDGGALLLGGQVEVLWWSVQGTRRG